MRTEGPERGERDLGVYSRLGRPWRTNVFDKAEMNFPAVVTTVAKYVNPSPKSRDLSTSKTDAILGEHLI